MNEFINIRKEKGNFVVSSREVAENFGKRHYNLVRDIENIIKKNPSEFKGSDYFIKATFIHRGNEYGKYFLTRGGFSLLTMGYTGMQALTWKLRYIEAFEGEISKLLKRVEELENIINDYKKKEEL